LVFVGVLSYSLYLWHALFLNPMNEEPWYTGFPQNVPLAIIAALASYYLVERPFLRLRGRKSDSSSLDEAASVASTSGQPVFAEALSSAGPPFR
jgi:peptidoglycan/LPS O-acetylase OafA/YrhL